MSDTSTILLSQLIELIVLYPFAPKAFFTGVNISICKLRLF